MELLLLRHGPAGDREAWARRGRDDDERPLTADGVRKTEKAARGLATLLPALDVIASSPLARAQQTAAVLARRFPKAKRLTWDELKPGADPAALSGRLKGLKRAALVGHEPHLSETAARLLGCSGLKLELKKSGALLLDPEERVLRWLLRPSQLRSLR